jgi:hypothetical protein
MSALTKVRSVTPEMQPERHSQALMIGLLCPIFFKIDGATEANADLSAISVMKDQSAAVEFYHILGHHHPPIETLDFSRLRGRRLHQHFSLTRRLLYI